MPLMVIEMHGIAMSGIGEQVKDKVMVPKIK
jgi:hypothetical protein